MDEYKKYIPDGETIYPQKADSLKAYPGKNRIMLEWQIIDPKVDVCKVFWYQDSEVKSVDVPINSNSEYVNDTTQVIIDDLEESNYIFTIVSFDKMGNTSIPVEIEETSYGQMYEASLVNRVIRSKEFLPETGLTIEWYRADETEINVELSYTNLSKEQKTVIVSNESTSSSLPDFNVEYPFFYTTSYKPDSMAIDTFYTAIQEERVAYYADITHIFLQNTGDPFQLGDMVHDNRFYAAPGWKTNAAGGTNGNIDILKNSPNHVLTLWAWSGYSPISGFENGKLYQTVELEAGTYRFDALVHGISSSLNKAYVIAAVGEDLPDISDISSALASAVVPNDIKEADANKPTLSVEFILTEKSKVSLGFVANIGHAQETLYKKVKLWEKR
ncbi:DUF4998 domain-containing protein [uncultured Proteiniphilum sp.]|uniref:DUF4998 domain-containing protein n=1 Tax=uncultured Proteiniphilum sp. TaxID=497637 RepID=UPI00261E21FD|nr:DUF4998 domain-containing protein [uncultured Proteiniphilum sp.]